MSDFVICILLLAILISRTDAILIIDIRDFWNVQGFSGVKLLLIFQDPFVKELLKFLVAVVYAKLLETIDFEVFYIREKKIVTSFALYKPEKSSLIKNIFLTKSCNIQYANIVT